MDVRIDEKIVETEKAFWKEEYIQEFNDSIFSLITESLYRKCETNLRGVVFPAGIVFTGKEIYAANFNGSTFSDDAIFKSVHFYEDALFNYVLLMVLLLVLSPLILMGMQNLLKLVLTIFLLRTHYFRIAHGLMKPLLKGLLTLSMQNSMKNPFFVALQKYQKKENLKMIVLDI